MTLGRCQDVIARENVRSNRLGDYPLESGDGLQNVPTRIGAFPEMSDAASKPFSASSIY